VALKGRFMAPAADELIEEAVIAAVH